MKKFMTLLLAAGMMMTAANGASAADLKVSGGWGNSIDFSDNMIGKDALNKDRKGDEGHFDSQNRLRLDMDFVVSEALSGRMQLQSWTFGFGTENVLKARMLYVDWLVPGTDVQVRMGLQPFAMPSYVSGSPILDDPFDGVSVHAPINDMVALNAGWIRLKGDMNLEFDQEYKAHGNVDLAYLNANISGENFEVTPWFMAGRAGSRALAEDGKATGFAKTYLGNSTDAFNGGSNVMLYWAGLGGELNFDPFRFTADFAYTANDADNQFERKGWYAALGAEMNTEFGTPFVKGWYASGEDDDLTNGSERMLGNMGGAFDVSPTLFDGDFQLFFARPDHNTPYGTWGVELGIKGVSFMDKLSHNFNVTYVQGTNDEAFASHVGADTNAAIKAMTSGDRVFDFGFTTTYEVYKNLSAGLLLAYMVTDFDEDLAGRDFNMGNSFRGTLCFFYGF